MEEKIYNLMEKMYEDLSGKIDCINSKMDNMESEITDIKSKMATKQDIARLENKMDDNFKALYDGYKQSLEGIAEIRGKLKDLNEKVENQEIKLQVLKTVK